MPRFSARPGGPRVPLCSLIAAALLSFAAAAQNYPAKPVRVVVPFPPGGTNDIVARLIARELAAPMGRQFIIDNRGGASGVIGAEAAAKSPPDGYTIMVHSTSHLTNAFSYKKLPYDTFKDFEPITLLAQQPSGNPFLTFGCAPPRQSPKLAGTFAGNTRIEVGRTRVSCGQ